MLDREERKAIVTLLVWLGGWCLVLAAVLYLLSVAFLNLGAIHHVPLS